MKRDLDLVRCILIQVESADKSVPIADLTCDKWGTDEVAYHVELMQAHGLLDANIYRGASGAVIMAEVVGLTWDGYDYLDAIRSDTVWTRTKKLLSETVGSTTMTVIKEAASLVALQVIKTGLGSA